MKFHDRIEQWKRAERSGDEARSERLLTALMEALPMRAPSPSLVDAVLGELGLSGAPRSRFAVWSPRALLVAAVLVVALAVPLAPGLALVLLPSAGDVAGLVPTLLRWVAEGIALAVSVWSLLARVAGLVSLVLATPQALAALTATLALGWASFRWLDHLTSMHRSASHADPI